MVGALHESHGGLGRRWNSHVHSPAWQFIDVRFGDAISTKTAPHRLAFPTLRLRTHDGS
jgi:hypothetical protein